MSWWGTLLGGTLGYMFGGPLGALLGAILGRNFDRGLTGTAERDAVFGPGRQERVQAAFFTATFSVMGHMAKADGRVTRAEISAAETIMTRMRLDAAQRKAAITLFNEGKREDFPLHEVLAQFRHECHGRRHLLQMFLEIQIATAMADGRIHRGERHILYQIGDALGFNRAAIEQLFGFVGAGQAPEREKHSLANAYRLLGVDPDAEDAAVKKAYRRLMNQHHPDKLIAKGLPEEMIKLATEKTREIKDAYELIKARRESSAA
jgi:DnaJ like chaperone protein